MEKLSFASKGSEPPGWLLEAAPTLWPSVMDVIGDARSLGCRTDDEGSRTYWLEPLVGIPPFRSQGEGEQNFVAGIMTQNNVTPTQPSLKHIPE